MAGNRRGSVPSRIEHLAIVSGAFMLAAARRLSRFNGRWIPALGGGISTGWGILLATIGPDVRNLHRIRHGWTQDPPMRRRRLHEI
jgi:hypothetical protein